MHERLSLTYVLRKCNFGEWLHIYAPHQCFMNLLQGHCVYHEVVCNVTAAADTGCTFLFASLA